MSRVPAGPIIELISPYLENRWGGDAAVLAEKVGISQDTLGRILDGRSETIEFDWADALICATVGPMVWYSPELEEIYLAVDISGPLKGMRICSSPECERMFTPADARQRCCSETCAQRKWHLEHRVVKVELERQCDGCGETFELRQPKNVHDGSWKRQRFCTPRCRSRAESRRRRQRQREAALAA